MRVRVLLAAFLLGVGLCFVPALGYGEVKRELYEGKVEKIDFLLLKARVNYVMRNPNSFLTVDFDYDLFGLYGGVFEKFPVKIDTMGKVFIRVIDNRDHFSYKTGIALLDQFKAELEAAYSYIKLVATDMDADIVAKFHSREGIPLGYFYQGEYHLWGE